MSLLLDVYVYACLHDACHKIGKTWPEKRGQFKNIVGPTENKVADLILGLVINV